MDTVTRWLVGYLLQQANKTTAWIGFIGVFLTLLHLYSVLFFIFILLIVMPEANFSNTFREWAKDLQNINKAKS